MLLPGSKMMALGTAYQFVSTLKKPPVGVEPLLKFHTVPSLSRVTVTLTELALGVLYSAGLSVIDHGVPGSNALLSMSPEAGQAIKS